MRKRNRLELKTVDLISLVDRGDNPEAHVMIHKKKGFPLGKKGVRIDNMDSNNKDDRVNLLKRIAVYFGVGKDDLNLDGGDEMDKDAEKLQKDLDELKEKFEELGKEKATADAVSAALEGISKAKTPEEVDAVLEKIEDTDDVKGDDVRGAVAGQATERKTSFEKAAGEAEVKAFRARLPEELHESFDKLDEEDRGKFMKSFNEPGEDPTAQALETLTKANAELAAKVEKIDSDVDQAKVEEELKSLDGIVKSVPETAKTIVTLRKTDAEAADAMLEEYKSLAKQAEEKGELFKILGHDEDSPGDADAEIDKIAKTLRDADPDLSEAQAIAKAVEENPEVYDKYLEDKDGK